MEFKRVLSERFSERRYTNDPVSDRDIIDILEAIDTAPSAGNLQSYKVVVVRDGSMRKELADASSGQTWMAQAPVFLVFFADLDQFHTRYGEQHTDTMPLQDATIAMAYAQLAATDVGLGTCWIGTFARYQAQDILRLSGNLQFAGILTLGHPKGAVPARNRRGHRSWGIWM